MNRSQLQGSPAPLGAATAAAMSRRASMDAAAVQRLLLAMAQMETRLSAQIARARIAAEEARVLGEQNAELTTLVMRHMADDASVGADTTALGSDPRANTSTRLGGNQPRTVRPKRTRPRP